MSLQRPKRSGGLPEGGSKTPNRFVGLLEESVRLPERSEGQPEGSEGQPAGFGDSRFDSSIRFSI